MDVNPTLSVNFYQYIKMHDTNEAITIIVVPRSKSEEVSIQTVTYDAIREYLLRQSRIASRVVNDVVKIRTLTE